MELKGLEKGELYRFYHRRKGEFVAKFIGWEEGDEADPMLLSVQINTSTGSGQERLANVFTRDKGGTKIHVPLSPKLLRPSLISKVEEVDSDV